MQNLLSHIHNLRIKKERKKTEYEWWIQNTTNSILFCCCLFPFLVQNSCHADLDFSAFIKICLFYILHLFVIIINDKDKYSIERNHHILRFIVAFTFYWLNENYPIIIFVILSSAFLSYLPAIVIVLLTNIIIFI